MGLSKLPASQVSSFVIGQITVTPKGDITIKANQIARKPLSDAHTSKRKLMATHVPGTLTCTILTDLEDDQWRQVIEAEDAPISIRMLSGRTIEIPAADNVTDGGVSGNTTQGESSEMTFQFDAIVDGGPPQP